MSKRSIKHDVSTTAVEKKIKLTNHTTSLQSIIPDDLWSQNIFSFLDGNELFKSKRLVCSLWNDRVLSTRCAIQVYFPKLTNSEQPNEVYSNVVREFIECGERGFFKNITELEFKSQIHPSFFEKIVNLDWKTLHTLCLRDNLVNQEGAKQLANGNMKGLTCLDLSNNTIGSEGIKSLSNGNIKGITSLKVFNNEIGEEGAKYILRGNLNGLTTLNYQKLEEKGENHYYAITDHFCGETPLTTHRFESSDDLTAYMFRYYINYWKQYGGETLGLEDGEDNDEENPNESLLKEKVYALPFGKIADMAVNEVGDMVYNECESESIVSTIYGKEINADNFGSSNDFTPFVTVMKIEGYDHKKRQIIGKTRLLEMLYIDINGDHDEIYETIVDMVEIDKSGDKGLLAVFIGEIVSEEFVELK